MHRYEIQRDVFWVKTGDDTVLILDSRSGAYLQLNAVGSVIWCALAIGKTLQEAGCELSAEYEISDAQLAEDVRTFVDEMVRLGLLE